MYGTLPRRISMSHADKIICELGSAFTDNVKNMCDVKVIITHDGYDDYGPKSDICLVYVLHKIDGDLVISYFNRENWFDGPGGKFYLEKSYLVKDKAKLPAYLPIVCMETEKFKA